MRLLSASRPREFKLKGQSKLGNETLRVLAAVGGIGIGNRHVSAQVLLRQMLA